MSKLFFLILSSVMATSLTAQQPGNIVLPAVSPLLTMQPGAVTRNITSSNWSVTSYSGITAGTFLLPGRATSYLSPLAGVQVNRRLGNHLYAFAGATVAPLFFNASNVYSNHPVNNGFMTNSLSYRPGVYSGIQAGWMYVNEDKTFSISGSVSVGNYMSSAPFPSSQANRPIAPAPHR